MVKMRKDKNHTEGPITEMTDDDNDDDDDNNNSSYCVLAFHEIPSH